MSAPGADAFLFAYGTLMRGFRLHGLLEGQTRYEGSGWVPARLLDLGTYPAAVPDATQRVRGEVYRVTDPTLWGALDSAEGPQYHRGEALVRTEDGRELRAGIYWYAGPLAVGVPIPGGDYRAHGPARSIHTNLRP